MIKRLTAVIALVAACTLMGASARADDHVNLRFSWKLKGEYAPFYLAQAKGFFAKEGLSVRMGEGAGSQAALGGLLQGQEDVVVIPGIYALTAVAKGLPVKIVALYQPRAPVAIISMPDKPITTPKALEGKSLIGTVGDTTTDYLTVFCRMNHIDCRKIKLVMLNVQARIPQFLSRRVDAMSTYWDIDVPTMEAATKIKFAILDVAKYGLIEPGLSVVTSDREIAQHPDRLKHFLAALSRGFVATKTDVPGAVAALQAVWQAGPSTAILTRQVRLANETFIAPRGKPEGWVERRVITAALSLLKESGQISTVKPLDSYYTNALLAR